jgi:hypothetical protein
LSDIAEVTTGDVVEIIHQNASRTVLPVTRYAFVNEEMVADIRTAIRDLRALVTDYRGTTLTST